MTDRYRRVSVRNAGEDGSDFRLVCIRDSDIRFERVGSVSIEGRIGLLLEETIVVTFEDRVDVDLVDYTDEYGYVEAEISPGDGASDLRV